MNWAYFADYQQIRSRFLCWNCGKTLTLQPLFKGIMDIFRVMAN